MFKSGMVVPLVPVFLKAAVPKAVPLLLVHTIAPVDAVIVQSPFIVRPAKEPLLFH